MATLGNVPAEAYTNTVKDSFSGNGSTTAFTMSLPTVTNDVRVVVENVIQDPTVAYSVSGTTLTFTSAPPTGTNNIYVVHLGPAVMTTVPPAEIADATTFASSLTVQGAFTSKGIDDNADATALTIDSSENVQFGTTQTFPAFNNVVGCEVGGFGQISASRDGAEAMQLNRKSSDGDIALFKKDGTTVGSVGTVNSGLLVGSTDSALYFNTDNSIYPYNPSSSAYRNGDVDLGWSGARFKDIYTSGGIYLGGTGSANHLKDYETGTFTPSLEATSSNPTSVAASVSGHYVKVGSLVMFRLNIAHNSISGGSGVPKISGLPFTAPNNTNWSTVTLGYMSCSSGTTPSAAMIQNNTNVIRFWKHASSDARSNVGPDLTLGDIGSSIDWYIAGSYYTDQ